MPGLNEIKASIANVKNTHKITRAMYLISASKSKSARAKLEQTRFHFNQIATTLSEILAETEGFDSPYIGNGNAESKNRDLYLVLSGDKGLAGSYNNSLIRLLEDTVEKERTTLWVAGHMGRTLITRKEFDVSGDFNYAVMNPNLFRAREVAELVVEAYLAGEYRHVYMAYTDMVTALVLKPCIVQLLPLKPEDLTHHAADVGRYEKVVYEPSPKAVFEHLMPHYLKGVIYGAFVDSFTSEQHARMFAMDNATKNANELMASLTHSYNLARQAQITQEIIEIVGGIPAE